jgi:hypothetical protein
MIWINPVSFCGCFSAGSNAADDNDSHDFFSEYRLFNL